jgi:hypothetical protein
MRGATVSPSAGAKRLGDAVIGCGHEARCPARFPAYRSCDGGNGARGVRDRGERHVPAREQRNGWLGGRWCWCRGADRWADSPRRDLRTTGPHPAVAVHPVVGDEPASDIYPATLHRHSRRHPGRLSGAQCIPRARRCPFCKSVSNHPCPLGQKPLARGWPSNSRSNGPTFLGPTPSRRRPRLQSEPEPTPLGIRRPETVLCVQDVTSFL